MSNTLLKTALAAWLMLGAALVSVAQNMPKIAVTDLSYEER